MPTFQIGSLVRCRAREWIVLPSERDDVLMLRPIGGSEAETCGIYLPLEEHTIQPASFDPPQLDSAGDLVSGQLLRDAARLSLRSGAGPFRSLGRLGARPRPYQLVPLIMALRLDPIRLLIADDVGIGKTVEAALIVRELLDRGEIRRLTVLCPPHLCDQWQRELATKFAIDAEVVRSSTIAALERPIPERERDHTNIWQYYPFTVTSIDYVKSDRNRAAFIQHCPELVIVDEAHTATRPGGVGGSQQQRYDLLREISAKVDRHLLLLTATPHSGIEESFLSLLGLLRGDFEKLNLHQLTEAQRETLSRHLIQRRRADVRQWLGEDTPFPTREWGEATYRLGQSPQYRKLFDDVFDFARELVQDDPAIAKTAGQRSRRVRVRYWAALALLRCVMSSPAAAEKALETRAGNAPDVDDAGESDDIFASYVHDRTEQEAAQDVEPTHVVEEASDQSERARLRRFAARARELRGSGDPKLVRLQALIGELLRDGYNPIVYCRYIATANYVAEELQKRIKGMKELQVLAVTGERSEEEREVLIAELSDSPRRLLIATDCLSEGINLQHAFDAVVHYDLPWNPNRLEQREGRVDRYGQPAATVRTLLLQGEDNPIDQVVMKVLLRKAISIHRTLGIAVPLPASSESVMETMIQSLFHAGAQQLSIFNDTRQTSLLDLEPQTQSVDQEWQAAVEREKASRTRFAQRQIKPQEVALELEESDAVLGDQDAVRQFVLGACQRIAAPLVAAGPSNPDVWQLNVAQLKQPVAERIRPLLRQKRGRSDTLLLSFEGVASPDIELVGRNHPLTAALADFLLETALVPEEGQEPYAARSGVVRTSSVAQRTILLLLRVRMLIESVRKGTPMLAEELVVCGFTGTPASPQWLDQPAALALLSGEHPLMPLTRYEREEYIEQALGVVGRMGNSLDGIAREKAQQLELAHNRVRAATKAGRARVTPNLPPDVLGVYVMVPGQ